MSMFERELDYYGIDPEKGAINQKTLPQVIEDFHLSQSKNDMFFLALEAHYQYSMKKIATSSYVGVQIRSDQHKIYSSQGLSPEEITLFENYLDKYFGLKMYDTAVGNRANPPPNRCAHFYVCAKK